MTVTILTERATPEQVRTGLSPLAELGAALHQLTAVDHPRTAWSTRTWAGTSPQWRRECELFAPCWGGYRLRLLFPLADSSAGDIDDELDELARTPIDTVTDLAWRALTGVDRDSAGALAREWVPRYASGRAAGPAAALLHDDPAQFLRRLTALLAASWSLFFAADWVRVRPTLRRAADRADRTVRMKGLHHGIAALAACARPANAPSRVVLDKLHHAVLDVSRTPLIAIPTIFGSPHVLLKHDAGWPAVLQYPVHDQGQRSEPRRAPVEVSQLRARCRLLADPVRVQICRSVARHPRSTGELAEAFGVSSPEMSRHLRALRDAGLVRTERAGRFVLYTIRHDEVLHLGSDLMHALLR